MESLAGKKTIFSWTEKATGGSSFQALQKKVFQLKSCTGKLD